jgi:hypothetical protein
MSETQRNTLVAVGKTCRIKNLVCCVAAGRWKWKVTRKADSLQTDVILLECVSRKVTVDGRCGALVGPH